MIKDIILKLKNKILNGHDITIEEAKKLMEVSIDNKEEMDILCQSANEIRERFCGNNFDLCTIMNAKSGKCSENCKYCAQSSHFKTNAEVYDLISSCEAIEEAKKVEAEGAYRFSLVTSGRGLKQGDKDLQKLCDIYKDLKNSTNISLCASHGICDEFALKELYDSGVSSYHHNLETSRKFYPNICTTHSYDDRINTIKKAQKVGLNVCSGGIWGLGETLEDRIEMAFDLQNLNIKSVPLNILMPIEGTPLGHMQPLNPKEILRTIAIYRFILPKAYLRYAGGRINLKELQEKGIQSGINSALTGNFLTTTGTTIESDKEMIRRNGYEIK